MWNVITITVIFICINLIFLGRIGTVGCKEICNICYVLIASLLVQFQFNVLRSRLK